MPHRVPMRILMVLWISLFCLIPALRAESPKNTLMIQPMALALGTVSVEYERVWSDIFSLGVRANGVYRWEIKGGKNDDDPSDDYDWHYTVTGVGIGLSARYYPGGEAPRGFYVGPRFDFNHYSGTYEDLVHHQPAVDSSFNIRTAHLEGGYKLIFGDSFIFGLFADGGYAASDSEDATALLNLYYVMGGGIYLGWAF